MWSSLSYCQFRDIQHLFLNSRVHPIDRFFETYQLRPEESVDNTFVLYRSCDCSCNNDIRLIVPLLALFICYLFVFFISQSRYQLQMKIAYLYNYSTQRTRKTTS